MQWLLDSFLEGPLQVTLPVSCLPAGDSKPLPLTRWDRHMANHNFISPKSSLGSHFTCGLGLP